MCFFSRYCVVLITGEEESFTFGNEAFLTLASLNTNDILRFAYVYQRHQQALCDVLLKNNDGSSQVSIIFGILFKIKIQLHVFPKPVWLFCVELKDISRVCINM